MKTMIAGLGLIAAASFGVVAAVPAPAMAADNTVNLSIDCVGPCTGTWTWYQGGTVLSSGSISDDNVLTKSTTDQPATADSVGITLRTAGAKGCSTGGGETFSPGSPINVSVKINSQPNAYHNGCHASFSMKS